MASSHLVISIADTSQVGEARRAAGRLAEELPALDASDRGNIAILVSELATNLARHTTGGQILLRKFDDLERAGIEVLSIDRGPGMANVSRCMEDGYSTGGTAGNGLGAIRRLASDFDIFSTRPGGTVIVARVMHGGVRAGPAARLQWGVVCVPAPLETECGDSWSIVQKNGMAAITIADGLGHGPLAAKASSEAIALFETSPFLESVQLFDKIHWPLRSTRGAAMAIAQLDHGRRTVRYAGVGNIAGTIFQGGKTRGMCSLNGTVGLQIPKVQNFDYAWPEGGMLIMHSDGINTRWDLQAYPGLANRHPSIIASVLYRDFLRGRDDATVLVAR